ncbi:MAG TPA: carboxypeptidase-like regulatory domain-containing protein, partial [Vicinamibacterales bacterium]|nr:carboxypeptidase-like regulatory domain-containing protein [Vicinamibacterales bacterium]
MITDCCTVVTDSGPIVKVMTRLLLVALLAIPLAAEDARIEGRVVHQSDPLPGVTVRVGARVTVTDAEGRYAFEDVEPGLHELRYELAGFGDSTRRVETVSGTNVLRDEDLPVTAE